MLGNAHNLLTLLRLARLQRVLVVLALAVTHLAGFTHFALVQHEQCPEHGEWLHVHASAAHAAPSTGAACQSADSPDDHDHCSAPTALRDRAPAPGLATSSVLLAFAVPLHAPSPALGLRGAPQVDLRLAPKTSPPV